MSDLAGKTIAWTQEWPEMLFFDDGTAFEISDEGGSRYLDHTETRAYLRKQQGERETARMRRLHDMLHPRDKQYLRLLQRKRDETRRQSLSVFERAFEDIVRGHRHAWPIVRDQRRSDGALWLLPGDRRARRANRMLFTTHELPPLKRKRKRRPRDSM